MSALLPWNPSGLRKRYVRSEATDLRKTFKAARKRLLREETERRRRERRLLKAGVLP